LQDFKKQLQIVRRYTGDKFSSEKGYDLRKPISKARMKTVHKYYEMILELTTRPHKTVAIPKGWKREMFEFTGQKAHPRFVKAIIHTPDPEAKYEFSLDKSRPKGSRFNVVNKRTQEKSWHIPAKVFIEGHPALFNPDLDIPASFFQQIIEEYGEEGRIFMIEAGEGHMWGSAGSAERVGEKLSSLFKNYGSDKFDPGDKNSHFIGNWFRGVQVYSDVNDLLPYVENRTRAEVKRLEKYGLPPFTKYKLLRNGQIGYFLRGELQFAISPQGVVQTSGWNYKPASAEAQARRREKLRRRALRRRGRDTS